MAKSVYYSSAFKTVLIGIVLLSTLTCSKNVTSERQTADFMFASAAFVDNGVPDIEGIIENMTIREKAAQLMHVWAFGQYQTDDSDRFERMRRHVEDYKVGGIIFSRGYIYGQAVLTNKLQELSDIPLWVSQDMEYGAAMRITSTTRFTPAMGIAASGNPDFAYEKGRITALEAKALGVHQIYAPVLDVNNNPENPVINTRSYSEDPGVVTEFANAFIRGAQNAGVIATAKHFPGHGDTSLDSHFDLPVITHSWERLDSVELAPFRAAVKAGVRSIMSAHIAFPNIGDDPGRPGTLDPAILGTLLRDSLKFDGIITTDALQMDAIANNYSPGDATVKAILAGADMLLIPADIETAIDAVVQAVEDGVITENRLDESVRRILELKAEFGLFNREPIEINALSGKINPISRQIIADEVARSSITVLKNRNVLPIRTSRYPKLSVISLAQDRSGNTGSSFAEAIRNYHPDVLTDNVDLRSSQQEINRVIERASGSSAIVLAIHAPISSGSVMNLPSHQTNFINRLKALNKPLILVAVGNPYSIRLLPEAHAHVLTWSDTNQQTTAAVHALFGASDVIGKTPIRIPGMYQMGDGLDIAKSVLREDAPEIVGMSRDSLRNIDSIIRDAIRNETFPGASVAVIKDGIVVYHKGFGYHDYTKREATQKNDVFDLASITKVMATTLGIMKLVDEGRISLDDPISKYFNEFKEGKRAEITIRHTLLHTSGLPAFRVYVDSLKTRSEIIRAILNEPLINDPGERYVYSDLGMIINGLIIEKVTGMRLDTYLDRTFYTPLGMNMTTFVPSRRASWYTTRILPTEIDTVYRNGLVRGVVHDERAYYLNGLAGHAGLFSTSSDIAIFSQLLLNGGFYGGIQYLRPSTVELFTRRQGEFNNRALGFDMRTLDGFTTAGERAGDNTFGHTGFTGTSFWVDPDRNTVVILLTNRTFPYRTHGSGIASVRAAVADAVYNSIFE